MSEWWKAMVNRDEGGFQGFEEDETSQAMKLERELKVEMSRLRFLLSLPERLLLLRLLRHGSHSSPR